MWERIVAFTQAEVNNSNKMCFSNVFSSIQINENRQMSFLAHNVDKDINNKKKQL